MRARFRCKASGRQSLRLFCDPKPIYPPRSYRKDYHKIPLTLFSQVLKKGKRCGYLTPSPLRCYNYYMIQKRNLTVIRAIGSSLGAILPAQFLHAQKMKRGDTLVVRAQGDDRLILTKLKDDK